MRVFKPLIVCMVLLLIGGGGAWLLVVTAPEAERTRPPRRAVLVETIQLQATDETAVLELAGTVKPAEEIILRTRVSGEIISIAPDFIDGGHLAKGSEILQIDPIDYELMLVDAQARFEQAVFDNKLEMGRQDIAEHEWELLKVEDATERERELALRIPHLAASRAALAAAQAALVRSRLNLERTSIKAPFNALVLERHVNIGSQASPQDPLARLVGTDAYWVVSSSPLDRLQWVTIPGSRVKTISGNGSICTGTVIRLLGALEERGRMARLLIEVEDPLGLQSGKAMNKPLLLDEYVRVQIEGRQLPNVFRIPRSTLRENSMVWLANEGKLDIRPVEVLFRDSDHVFVRDGLESGETLITSDITAPVPGMLVNSGLTRTAQRRE